MQTFKENRRLLKKRAIVKWHAFRDPRRRADAQFVDAGKPLILISEIQRSGGTLLSQLFDGHPEVFAHPAEIEIGYPNKWDWLTNVRGVDDWLLFEKLCQQDLIGMGLSGNYRKGSESLLPFEFSVGMYRNTFLSLVQEDDSPAGLYRASMSAVFTAWLDYHHKDREALARKRFVSGFVPRLIMFNRSVESLLESSPDAKILTIIRDPFSWYASAKAHDSSYRDIGKAMNLWVASARASLTLAKQWPDFCKQIYFSNLTRNSQETMRSVAEFCGIAWDQTLLTPTFNGLPIVSDSKFKGTLGAIDPNVVARSRSQLAADEANFIEQFVRSESDIAGIVNQQL